MITPIEIQKTEFKVGAAGYNKQQVDEFKAAILKDYEHLYRQNLDLNDKLNQMNDKLQYYTSMEKSLHKALVLAEKSAEETKRTAEMNAEVIEKNAKANAKMIVADAKSQLNFIYEATLDLVKQYDRFKAQFMASAKAQLQLLSSDSFKIDETKLEAYTKYLVDRDKTENIEDVTDDEEEEIDDTVPELSVDDLDEDYVNDFDEEVDILDE